MNDSSHTPPPQPWQNGDHENYAMARILVEVCLDSSGRVFSNHRLSEPIDGETLLKWPGGGQEQVAFGLLVEAVRREAILGLLLMLSSEPELMSQLRSASSERKDIVTHKLAEAIRQQTAHTVGRIAESVAKEAVQAVIS